MWPYLWFMYTNQFQMVIFINWLISDYVHFGIRATTLSPADVKHKSLIFDHCYTQENRITSNTASLRELTNAAQLTRPYQRGKVSWQYSNKKLKRETEADRKKKREVQSLKVKKGILLIFLRPIVNSVFATYLFWPFCCYFIVHVLYLLPSFFQYLNSVGIKRETFRWNTSMPINWFKWISNSYSQENFFVM